MLMTGPALVTSCASSKTGGADTVGKGSGTASESITDWVITAMLTMQRASWEHGCAMQAVWEVGRKDLAVLMAKEAVLRQLSDGRLSVVYSDNGTTDPAASGEVVYRMAVETQDPALMAAHKKMRDYLLHTAPRSDDGIIYHTLNSPEFWLDSMYMAPPYLCVAGEIDESLKLIEGLRKYLWNKNAKLYSHRWHNGEKKFINEKFWGVGNGWAIAAMVRIIDDLPPDRSRVREKLIGYATDNMNGCLKHLRPDGLFHNIIDDSATFVETNLSQMIAYAIYRGAKSGWLDKRYIEQAEKMREAALHKVDKNGFVQDVCGAPFFETPGRAVEGQAFFILMEAARDKFLSNV
jgi:rhamnogalacturonyl hydrolase YesR